MNKLHAKYMRWFITVHVQCLVALVVYIVFGLEFRKPRKLLMPWNPLSLNTTTSISHIKSNNGVSFDFGIGRETIPHHVEGERKIKSQGHLPFLLPLNREKKTSVCILIPITSQKQTWIRIEDTFLIRFCLSSLMDTLELSKYYYFVYAGYDVGDPFFDNKDIIQDLRDWNNDNLPNVTMKFLSFENSLKKPGPIMNFLSAAAYTDGCDFLYRINDDTQFKSSFWTSNFISTLQEFDPPYLGVVGPTCYEGNTEILTHDFVHRTHIHIFGTHYPPELTDWWLDDWISLIYGPNNTMKVANVVVTHHTLSTRYDVNWGSKALLFELVNASQIRIRNFKSLL
jgi:hypothetical protein